MPEFVDHEYQAKHNARLLEYLRAQGQNKDFSDWYITIAFYSAVHLVEAEINANEADLSYTLQNESKTRIFFKCTHSEEGKTQAGCHSEHEFRLRILKQNRRIFGNMYAPFANLYERSRMARYQCYVNKENDFNQADTWISQVRQEYAAFMKKMKEPPAAPAGLSRKL